MFKVGHQVTAPGGLAGVVKGNKGFGLVYVNFVPGGALHEFKPGQLRLATEVSGWKPAVKGMLKVGDEVLTADNLITTVKKLAGDSWIHCNTRPQDHHINTLRVRSTAAVTAFGSSDFDGCTEVVEDATWKKLWSAWAKALQTTHKYAVTNYTGTGYVELNKALRGGQPAELIKYCDRLDAAVAMGMLDRDATIWRSGSSKFDKATPVGAEFTDLGFGSCSIRKDFAFGWGGGHKALFEIRCKAGTVGSYVAKASSHPGEGEFILPRGARYRVVAIRTEHGRSVFTVDLIGQ